MVRTIFTSVVGIPSLRGSEVAAAIPYSASLELWPFEIGSLVSLTLVDADLASNTQGWQWAAGCGADAAPYFRIFNPITQGEKFDKSGRYARRWIPELGDVPNKWLFRPWEAPSDLLSEHDLELGGNYPNPCVDHFEARARALQALSSFKDS